MFNFNFGQKISSAMQCPLDLFNAPPTLPNTFGIGPTFDWATSTVARDVPSRHRTPTPGIVGRWLNASTSPSTPYSPASFRSLTATPASSQPASSPEVSASTGPRRAIRHRPSALVHPYFRPNPHSKFNPMFDWASDGSPVPSFLDSRTVTPSVVSQPQRSFGTPFSEAPVFMCQTHPHSPPQSSPSPDTLTATSIASIPVVSPIPRPCVPAMLPVPAPVDPAASHWTHQPQSNWARASPMPTAAFPVPQSCGFVASPPPIHTPSAITHPSTNTYQSWHAPSPAVPNLSPKFPASLTPMPFPPAPPVSPTVSPPLSAAPMAGTAPSVAISGSSVASIASTPAHRTRNTPSYEQPQPAPHDQGASRGIGIFGKYGRQVVSFTPGS